jgi:hypothetical protein
MIVLLLTLVLNQSACRDAPAMLAAARERAALLDVKGAATLLASDLSGCTDTAVPYWYLRGLLAARDAYRYGGSPESLEPVTAAIAELASRSSLIPAAEIARVVLMAASSAAQSEREEMALFLEHALTLERQQRSAGLAGAPMVSAHEVAGDLWLQVHRFDDARQAYVEAVKQVGSTRRTTLGLARTAFRLGDQQGACEHYQSFVKDWPRAAGESAEQTEARTFLRRPDCRKPSQSRSRR